MAKASEEGLGPKWAVVPLLMMMMIVQLLSGTIFVPGLVQPISVTKFITGIVVSRS